MDNQTYVSEFLLMEFSKLQELQFLHFILFLVLYLVTVTGNLLIISAVAFDHRLHTPMYFFLMNLALQDLGTVSAITPKAMSNLLMNARHISYSGCVAQVFFFVFFVGSDFFLLTIMAYDRYVAICNPLQYEMVINRQACTQMITGVWITGLFYGALHTGGTFAVPFCSNIINQLYCEIPQLLKLTCSESYQAEFAILAFCAIIELGCFVFIVVTYVLIFITVLRIPSVQGRQKAFSTCIPHLTVFSLFIFTGWFAYLRPPSDNPSELDLALTVVYTFVPPMLNPVIYSMRNKEIKGALAKIFISLWSSMETYFLF
ncbi:olfactory receptor 14A16-like [Varanus komodoensis]|uniref:olfactory receptor 14A16-like n=1 Tax=Varanus komodoensis TaxID=61221 RepID=UPI001CF77B29|nr:olfactory receptor 14A16-like [Varanus komodoensis]